MEDQATIVRKHYSEGESERILRQALRGRKGALTKADAVTLSGLPVDETDSALRSLLGTYKSHLAVTDSGELIYSFDPAMVRRDAVPLRERMARFGSLLWRGFAFAFKVWIVVTLVAYVVAFVAMLVALVLARSSDRDDRRRGDGGFGGMWILYWMMPDWAPPEYRRRQRASAPKKRFYLSVFDFVFGPRRPPVDALAGEKQLLSYLRSVGGRITATDLVALTGWSYARAEEEATRLLADYDGEPEVTEDGTIVYSFPSLRTTVGDEPAGPWLYTWQEKRSLPSMTGNGSGANTAVVLMNAFNLISALAIGPAFLAKYGIVSPIADLAVTWFPLAFSAVFFAIPGVRWLGHRRLAARIRDAAARAALIGEVIGKRGAATAPEELVAKAAASTSVEASRVRAQLERLLVDLDGDVPTDEQGTMLYAFPRVDEELGAAARARLLANTDEQKPGSVIFSSKDPPLKPPSHLN